MTDQDWEKLNNSLIDVFSPNGTGYRINAGELDLAGKSGTAQVVDMTQEQSMTRFEK